MKWPFSRPPRPSTDPKRPPSHEVPILTHVVLPAQLRQAAEHVAKAQEILFLIEQGGIIDGRIQSIRSELARINLDVQAAISAAETRGR